MIRKIFNYLKKIKQEISSVVAAEDILIAAINGDSTQFNLLREKQEYYANYKTNFSFISKFYAAGYSGLKKINLFNRNKPSLNIMLKQTIEQACKNKNEENEKMAEYLFSLKKEFLFQPENIDLLKDVFQVAYNHKSGLTRFIYNQATIEIQSQLHTCLTEYESDPLINITDIVQVEELIKKAAETNDLTMMKNIYNTQNPKFSMAFGGLLNDPNIMEDAFTIAAKKSNMDIVKYLLESLPRCTGEIRPTVLGVAIKGELNNNQSHGFQLIRYLARHRFITTIDILKNNLNTANSGSIIQTQSQQLVKACSKELEHSINFVLIGLIKQKLESFDVFNIIFSFSGHSSVTSNRSDQKCFSSLLFSAIPRLHSSYQERRNASRNNEVPRLLDREQSATGQRL